MLRDPNGRYWAQCTVTGPTLAGLFIAGVILGVLPSLLCCLCGKCCQRCLKPRRQQLLDSSGVSVERVGGD